MDITKLKCGKCGGVSKPEVIQELIHYKCGLCSAVNEVLNIPLQEWLGFSYKEYIKAIKKFIDKDTFTNLLADSTPEVDAGYLTSTQIDKLKSALKESITKGESIRDISKRINEEVGVKDLLKTDGTKILTDEAGDALIKVSATQRAIMIARTETIRVSNMGALDHYEQGGVRQVRWLASMSSRTCETCQNLNGQIFDIDNPEFLELVNNRPHAMCRCSTIPVVNL